MTELEKAADEYANSIAQHDHNKVFSICDFKAGANWQYKQFQQKLLNHYDELTAMQPQIESGFIMQHLEKYNKTPTFIDAIEYGRKLMIDKAAEWLNNFYSEDRHCFLVKEDIEAFKKSMED